MKNLQEIKLPLSQTDYIELQAMLKTGQVKWKDLPRELKLEYNRTRTPQEEQMIQEYREKYGMGM